MTAAGGWKSKKVERRYVGAAVAAQRRAAAVPAVAEVGFSKANVLASTTDPNVWGLFARRAQS